MELVSEDPDADADADADETEDEGLCVVWNRYGIGNWFEEDSGDSDVHVGMGMDEDEDGCGTMRTPS
ncbi:hypothetical protein BHYA_0057g00240 [Botrytis hyacinthi]|uniref:Uncharacterized protein n=1 Tax=Botrytis hyacinthi TaxID=278943 RepID=A0A4Z1H1F2_9HELO|nr:hypothetical protein BHYA_0057g00240 [Botrytis hyacinthi]